MQPAEPAPGPDASAPAARARDWFERRGWAPHDIQREVWQAMADGASGLLHATTGSGKTLAVGLGAWLRQGAGRAPAGLQVLWITPMRALAADTVRALKEPLAELAPRWSVGLRTGDTGAAERARQDRAWPTVLVTTPESLSLMLTRPRAGVELASVHSVIVDEWHELIASKRGVQVQLALARLRRWNPQLVCWGLSATLGNLDEAMRTLVGRGRGRLVRGRLPRQLLVDTLIPAEPGRFSWGGHLGAQMQQPVVDEIERSGVTLVFTNVRSQAEIWYQLLLQARPDWAGLVALHHGSLDKGVREWVEAGLRNGRLKAVVATSSLDLGVDFLPVERVLQIGSAKGVARLLQRAGRSGHAPGRASRITLVPTNTLELVEAVAARQAALAGRVESRRSPDKPLDVLVQHLVTLALGGDLDGQGRPLPGFDADALFDELRSAPAYAGLARDEFDWALRFCAQGGDSLGAYPEYHRLARVDGRWCVPDAGIARRHKLQVGTIVAEASVKVAWVSGGSLGNIEEAFIARLSPGDCFVFAGRLLEFVRSRDLVAYVRKASKPRGLVPAWAGSKMPLSSELADAVQDLFDRLAPAIECDGPDRQSLLQEPELHAAWPMLQTQARLSRLPRRQGLLVERYRSREGHHLFLYPFAGRNVHIGLAQLLAWRLSRATPDTFSLSVNDLGLEILGTRPVGLEPADAASLFDPNDLLHDVLASLNAGELAQKRFREIARVAGLVFGGYPGAPKSQRQLQASSALFFQVFRRYDSGNRLLAQADAEVLAQELDIERLGLVLQRLAGLPLQVVELRAPSPLCLPLMVERLRERLSTEQLDQRLARLLAEADAALQQPAPRRRRP
jgi:ATP-dependent Lhr-like helicase